MKKKTSFEDACILRLVKILRFFARVLPSSFLYASTRAIGSFIYYISGRKKIAHRNLRAAFAGEKSSKELRQIARKSTQNVCITMMEMLRFPELTVEDFKRDVRVLGEEKIKPFHDRKQGMIFLAAHFGNWELLSIGGSMRGYPMVALARTQKHPRSDDYLNSIRSCKGTIMVKKGMSSIRQIITALKNGQVIGILSDQDGGQNGIFVDFFGRSSSCPRGVARFASSTGAPIFPVFLFREAFNCHCIEVEGPILATPSTAYNEEVERQTMQEYCKILESKIRRDPSGWLWAHRRWKSTPDRRVIILSDSKAGHFNQSLAVLDEIKKGRTKTGMPLHVTSRTIEIRFQNNFRKNIFAAMSILFFGHLPCEEFWLKYALEKASFEAILNHDADIVISTGSSLWAVNLAVAKFNAGKSFVVMKPPFCRSSFDAVIVPRHDKIAASKNVFVTQNILSITDSARAKELGEMLLKQHPVDAGRLKVGVLIGGDTDTYFYEPAIFSRKIQALKQAAMEKKAALLITTSRRTPAWAEEMLEKCFSDKTLCPFLVIANKNNPKDTVLSILGAADALIVSAESMSMVSEAVSSQKAVLVSAFGKNNTLKQKHQYFIAGLRFSGLAAVEKDENFKEFLESSQNGQSVLKARLVLESDKSTLQQAVKRVI